MEYRGSCTDPKTHKTISYSNETVLDKLLDNLDKTKTRFVWDGGQVATRK